MMEIQRVSETSRHTCGHCQQEVLTVSGCRTFGSAGWLKWRLPLKHGPDAVRQAALSGCPFFVWVWDQLRGSGTPPEQMKRTSIVLELEAMQLKKTTGSESSVPEFSKHSIDLSEQGTHEITGCSVKVETDSYAWTAGGFNVMSDWGMYAPAPTAWSLARHSVFVISHVHVIDDAEKPNADDPSASKAIARMIDGHTSSSQAISQIRRRLQHCCAHHKACKASPSAIRPNRFISVGQSSSEIKVVPFSNIENANAEPYAALSYCWGQDQSLKTTMANKLAMEQSLPLHLLPKTIQDAIHLTRELHIKLLWVDSLCLVQDDEDELAREVAKMQHYYGNSCITISAATPSSCSTGFLRLEPLPYISEDDILGPFYFPVDLGISERPAQLKLVTRRSPVEAIDSRAWTLQEGLLSHRLVSFGSRTIRWSCQTESYGLYGSQDLRGAIRAVRMWTWGDTKLWCTLVENYMARTLSNERDRLPAISGIGSFIRESVFKGQGSAFPARGQLPVTVGSGSTGGQGSMDASNEPGAVGSPNILPSSSSVPSRSSPNRPLGHNQYVKYAAGLLDISFSPVSSGLYESADFIAQLLWVPVRTASQGRRHDRGKSYVAPSWSWASHNGAVDMTITKIDDKLLEHAMRRATSEMKVKVREVRVVPTNPEAPFGSLSKASLTLECPISLDHHTKRILFDHEEQQATNDIVGAGIRYLQLFPDLLLQEEKYLAQLRGVPNGLVLIPAGLKGQNPATAKTWRRVGVYYTRRAGDKPEDPNTFGEQGGSSRKALGWRSFQDAIRHLTGDAYEETTII